jgi:hypothetical protein
LLPGNDFTGTSLFTICKSLQTNYLLEARVGIEQVKPRSKSQKTRLNLSAAETSLNAASPNSITASNDEIKPTMLNKCLQFPTVPSTVSARFSARPLAVIEHAISAWKSWLARMVVGFGVIHGFKIS